MSLSIKAVVLAAAESRLADLVVAAMPVPEPGPGEERIAVGPASLNPADWKFSEDGKPT